MLNINTVTVIGANGTMGANIAGIFAAFGRAKVYLVSRNLDSSRSAVLRAAKSVRSDSIKSRLIPCDYSHLERCVRESDLIFECVAENIDLKKQILGGLSSYLQESMIICSGTSGLSISELAKCLPLKLRKNFFGVHFFNPPYNLTLCELISGDATNASVKDDLSSYLRDTLYRTVVDVKDSPAFLGNRIGFQFINRALSLADEYKYSGGIDYIDSILGPFTGRTMPPLMTADFVGLDVHKAIVENIYENTNDYAHNTFLLPSYVEKLINEGKLGRKSGSGLYMTRFQNNGAKQVFVYDIVTGSYRERISYQFPFVKSMIASLKSGDYSSAINALLYNRSKEAELCLSCLLQYIIYALNAALSVGDNLSAADDVMATGFNWCPPLAMIEAFSSVTNVYELIEERLGHAESLVLDYSSFTSLPASKYDYRPFLKAKQ